MMILKYQNTTNEMKCALFTILLTINTYIKNTIWVMQFINAFDDTINCYNYI